VSVSVGGPIGWFALGPGDAYFPGYYGGHDYFNRVNAGYVNQTVVNNYYGSWSSGNVNYSQMTFANRDAPRALTAVPAAAFASGQPVATSAVAVNRTTMANARVLPRATVTPTQASLVAGRGWAGASGNGDGPCSRGSAHAASDALFAQRQAVLQRSGSAEHESDAYSRRKRMTRLERDGSQCRALSAIVAARLRQRVRRLCKRRVTVTRPNREQRQCA
jgi:hypothetical protein